MPETSPIAILIIDDDESLRSLLMTILEASGVQALCAETADDAIAELRIPNRSIQGVLLDLNLSQSRGDDLYNEIVSIDPKIAIFPMSGCSREEIEERFADKRIAGIITKPFLPSNLMITISEGLARISKEGFSEAF